MAGARHPRDGVHALKYRTASMGESSARNTFHSRSAAAGTRRETTASHLTGPGSRFGLHQDQREAQSSPENIAGPPRADVSELSISKDSGPLGTPSRLLWASANKVRSTACKQAASARSMPVPLAVH